MFKDNNKNITTTSSQEKKKIFLRKACFLKIHVMSADKSNISQLSKNLPVFGS